MNQEQIIAKLHAAFEAVVNAAPAAGAVILGAIVLKIIFNRVLRYVTAHAMLSRAEVAPLCSIVNWLILAVTVIVLLGVFGFNLGGLWAMLSTVFALIGIGFVAVWSLLSNISCTFIILVARPFAIGDDIEFPGEPVRGRVVDLNFLYTTLRAEDDALLQIPNNLIFQKVLRRRRGTGAVTLSEQLNRSEPAAK